MSVIWVSGSSADSYSEETDLVVLDTSSPRIVVAEPDHIDKMAVADGGDGVVADSLRLDVHRIQTFV